MKNIYCKIRAYLGEVSKEPQQLSVALNLGTRGKTDQQKMVKIKTGRHIPTSTQSTG